MVEQPQAAEHRPLAIAREKSDQLVERDQVVQSAYSQSEQIKAQAERDAQMIRQEADNYVMESLRSLEVEMERALTQVRNGIRTLQPNSQQEE